MNRKNLSRIFFFLTLFTVMAVPALIHVPAANAQAVIPTPTALADGRIIYIAQEGDTWWVIAVKMSVTEDQLYKLNNTTPNDPVVAGSQILIGVVTETAVPVEAQTTPTPSILTPAVKGYGVICVVLFDDANGNGSFDNDETQIDNGAVSLVDTTGQVNRTGATTTGAENLCFSDLPEGDYNLSAAVPDQYNATTSMNHSVKLTAGDRSIINFGAQPSGSLTDTGDNQTGSNNPLVAIVGGVLILGGIGLGVYFLRSRRQ
jgi:LPXTG-motif cell wall-anchored protein